MDIATLGAASSQLAVVTPVPPDTPEKAVLKQQNAILTDHVSWMAEHAEDYVYREKQKAVKTVEGALEKYRSEYDDAVREYHHRCQLEVTAQQQQLAQQGTLARQEALVVYQEASSQTNKANARVYKLNSLEQHAMEEMREAKTELSTATAKLQETQHFA